MTIRSIPQADLKAGYRAHKDALDAAARRVLESGWYILGAEVAAFETEFAAFVGARAGIGVGSGTDALAIALRALGVGRGDGVVTVSHTAGATVAAIEMAGATPVLVDVEPGTCTMDPAGLARALERPPVPVRAVIPVHLYGQPAAMGEIMALARRHGAAVVEDCAQAHGATLDGRQVGTFGDIAAFSLYPTKNLGALGDGGIITTDDARLADRCKALREYGWRRRYVSDETGVNSRLDELQAALLRVKLGHLAAGNARRRAIARRYDAALAGLKLVRPRVRAGAEHVYHLYVVETDAREDLRARLKDRGVGTNVHYPVPVHRQPAYEGRIAVQPDGLPVTDALAGRVLSLPLFPELTDDDADYVAAALRDALG
ncbi:MAG: DegT/DnrJ/EryC1/StrS family aminotransferase [Alphaproteobacteria bacterium]|nr:DegT/DnrJ/EryC1/StrS family aminotransferase [Alphaproteobacteria bacterium]